jgi:hypothetical protein
MVENLERALRRVQAEIGLDDSRNEAIHNAIRAENFAELIVPARAFIPTTTPDQHRAEFDNMLQMVAAIRDNFANIQRS